MESLLFSGVGALMLPFLQPRRKVTHQLRSVLQAKDSEPTPMVVAKIFQFA